MTPRTWIVALIVLSVAWTGCLGADPASQATQDPAATEDPAPATGGSNRSTPDGPADRSPGSTGSPVELVWADFGGRLFRVEAGTRNATPIPLEGDALEGTGITAIRWGPEGDLWATLHGPGGLARIDPGTGTVETLLQGEPLANPVAMAVVDERLLVVDQGHIAPGTPASPPVRVPRLVSVDPGSGDAEVLPLGSDPLFARASDGAAWFGLAARDGSAYLVTSYTDPALATPADTSDDEGTGALWSIDPATGAHELVATSPAFSVPDGLAVLENGSVVVSEWVPERPQVHLVDPETGAVSSLATLGEAGLLWGGELLPDGRVLVVAACGDPFGLGGGDCGPGALWAIDPATGDAEPLASDPRIEGPGHARVWPS